VPLIPAALIATVAAPLLRAGHAPAGDAFPAVVSSSSEL
jgi:hypothetical protein